MKLSEAFPSKWLKGDDLGDQQPVVTIEDVTLEEFDDRDNKNGGKKQKLALHFTGKEKGMICNVGMRNILAGHFGDDTDDWIGKRIRIMAVPFTSDKGDTTMVCRIHPKLPTSQQAAAPAPKSGTQADLDAATKRVVNPPPREPADQDGENVDPDLNF